VTKGSGTRVRPIGIGGPHSPSGLIQWLTTSCEPSGQPALLGAANDIVTNTQPSTNPTDTKNPLVGRRSGVPMGSIEPTRSTLGSHAVKQPTNTISPSARRITRA
jgi:hypothetical protein